MSFTTSARLSRSRYSVAVFGSTPLTSAVSKIFLSRSSYGAFFSRLVFLVNDATSEEARKMQDGGVEVLEVNVGEEQDVASAEEYATLKNALSGVDAVIDTAPWEALKPNADGFIKTLTNAGAALLLLASFDGSSRGHDSAFEAASQCRRTFANHTGEIKVISVDGGHCLDEVKETGESITDHLPLTSREDLARTLAELIILWGAKGGRVPDHVRVAGSIGPGRLADADNFDNTLVNPEEKCWKWETL